MKKKLLLFTFFIHAFFTYSQESCSQFLSDIGVCTQLSKWNEISPKGYTYIEESVGKFLVPSMPEDSFLVRLNKIKAANIPVYACNSFIPGSLKAVGRNASHDSIVRYATTAIRRASLAGVSTIVFGSGGSRRIPDGFSVDSANIQFVDLLKRLAPVAEQYHVIISIEVLNSGETNFINTLEQGAEIVNKVNHPNIKMLADFYHMLKENDPASAIEKYGSLIFHCHIAEEEGRAAPGVNREDFTPFFQALHAIGYKGCLSVECRWKDFSQEMPVAIQYIKSEIGEVVR